MRGVGDYDEAAGRGVNERLDLVIENELIDHGTSDDYYTPPSVFEALNVQFDLDVAGPPGGVPWIPAIKTLTVVDDGLVTPWVGKVWCNPPFSNIPPWIKKMREHGNGIALVGISKSAWCTEAWKSADAVLLLPANLKFIRASGNSESILTTSVLLGYGADNVEAMRQSNLGFVR